MTCETVVIDPESGREMDERNFALPLRCKWCDAEKDDIWRDEGWFILLSVQDGMVYQVHTCSDECRAAVRSVMPVHTLDELLPNEEMAVRAMYVLGRNKCVPVPFERLLEDVR